MKTHLYENIKIKKSNTNQVTTLIETDILPVIKFPALADTGLVEHGFSTRLGGKSEGNYASMNLSFTRGDDNEAVMENFKRFGRAVLMDYEDMVFTDQTHTTNVRIVTKEDKGKGIIKARDYTDIDGLVTNQPGIPLVTFYADCVPLFFIDPVREVIALSHSGWRGSVHKMGKKTVEIMQREFKSNPADIITAIGPSICQSCYEIGSDVAMQFKEAFSEEAYADFMYQKSKENYHLDLWKANEHVLREAGILPRHIAVTDICTCCNSEVLWSHRRAGAKRGSLAAFLMLKNRSVDHE